LPLENISSLDSELELPSWPRLRNITWVEVVELLTRLEQVREGTKMPGVKAHVCGSLLEALVHSVSLMSNVISMSMVFRPTGINLLTAPWVTR
ncbi:hypothetical protein, partial [Klebsiella pneumoniae]|uniref:hypothetical protein n=1 Tax=Klebsiella pneumoniae TaxID=573 RepID=UPI0025A2BD98